MNPGMVYVIGTLVTWGGWLFFAMAISNLMRLAANAPGISRDDLIRRMTLNAGFGAVLLVIGRVVPMDPGRPIDGQGIHIPLVWVLMNSLGWLGLVSMAMAAFRALQSLLGLTPAERQKRLYSALIWLAVSIGGWFFFFRSNEPPTYYRGVIVMPTSTLASVVAFALAAMGAMAWSARKSWSRGISKKATTYLALIVGSIIFGIPFAWLVVNSVKEDKDIAQADALRWTPYVTQTEKYFDPQQPMYEVQYKGQRVEGTILNQLAGDRVQMDINKPMALRGLTFDAARSEIKEIPRDVPKATSKLDGKPVAGIVVEELEDGRRRMLVQTPLELKGRTFVGEAKDVLDVRVPGLRWQNFPDALDFLPPETLRGLVYLKNTLILVVLCVIGTLFSCTLVAYAFARLKFFGSNFLFAVLLATMMLPGAVTMMPVFLIYRNLGWIDTLYPLWVPAFFAGAFNVFLLRQFISQIPTELDDAAKVDGCSYPRTLFQVIVPQLKPALAAIAVMTTLGTWNNFMGPLIYINSPEKMPIAYGLQLYNSSRGGEPGLLMAATLLSVIPIVLLFFAAQKYLIEGVTLSGLGGR